MQFQKAFFQGATDTRKETLRGSSHSCLPSLLRAVKTPLRPLFAATPLTATGSARLALPTGAGKAENERFSP